MSLQQIVREFPFLKLYMMDASQERDEIWQDALIQARVSRLSLEALGLTMESIQDREESFALHRYLEILDSQGEGIFSEASIEGDFATIGDALLDTFPIREKEWTEEVSYILYITDHDTAKIRRRIGSRKAYRVSKTDHREIVLFKMPKKTTLWQLLEKYRRQKKLIRQR